jgi:type VI secretion system protein ImpK
MFRREHAWRMSSDEDPFGLKDSDRTQFARPAPGGRSGRASSAPPSLSPAQGTPWRPAAIATITGTPGRGPLVECAFGLLTMIPLLRGRTPPAAADQLRVQIESELKAFSERAQAKGIDQRLVALGHYALCAMVDDVVLNTPWGAHSTWQASSLAGALHGDAAAGEHLFDYFDQAKDQPQRNRPALELIAVCLALGFEGQYRIRPQGQYELQQIRGDLLGVLQRLDPPDDGALSAHWQGAAAAHAPIGRRVPIWVYASAALAVLLVVYSVFLIQLGEAGDRLGDKVATLLPPRVVEIDAPRPPPPPPSPTPLAPRLLACLPEAARTQTDAVMESAQALRVRLPNAGLFTSGSAELQAAIRPTMTCLASVMKSADGKVLVVGFTDNIPIHTTRFPSNWELSKARADAVAAVIRPTLVNAIRVDGRADSEPIASNATEDGRSRNRRVEILLVK